MSEIAAAELRDWLKRQSHRYLEQVAMAMAWRFLQSSTAAHELEPTAVETVRGILEKWRVSRSRRRTLPPDRAAEFLLGLEHNQPDFFLQEKGD